MSEQHNPSPDIPASRPNHEPGHEPGHAPRENATGDPGHPRDTPEVPKAPFDDLILLLRTVAGSLGPDEGYAQATLFLADALEAAFPGRGLFPAVTVGNKTVGGKSVPHVSLAVGPCRAVLSPDGAVDLGTGLIFAGQSVDMLFTALEVMEQGKGLPHDRVAGVLSRTLVSVLVERMRCANPSTLSAVTTPEGDLADLPETS